MAEYKSIEDVEEKFMPDYIKYPVVLRIRVSAAEEAAIMEWLRRRR